MRSISLLGLLCLCSIDLVSQEKRSGAEQVGEVSLQAEQISTDQNLFTLKGHVRVFMNRVCVYADEAEFNGSTRELTPRGHVRIRMLGPVAGKQDTGNNPTDTPLSMPKIPKR